MDFDHERWFTNWRILHQLHVFKSTVIIPDQER